MPRRKNTVSNRLPKPLFNHGSYSLYFLEPGTNGWEIECYEPALRKESMARKAGGVYAPHWTTPYPAERFPVEDMFRRLLRMALWPARTWKRRESFIRILLGWKTHQANPNVFYIKHPNTKCYVVCARRQDFKRFSPNFRFTITVGSQDEVVACA